MRLRGNATWRRGDPSPSGARRAGMGEVKSDLRLPGSERKTNSEVDRREHFHAILQDVGGADWKC